MTGIRHKMSSMEETPPLGGKIELRTPAARAGIIDSLAWLSTLDRETFLDRIIIFDNATAVLDVVLDEGDLRRFIGDVLYTEEEARALAGLRAAVDCLYDLIGRPAANEQIVAHRYLPAIVSAASYALLVMNSVNGE